MIINNYFLDSIKSIPGFKSKKFLVACSGGVDSMVLVHLCNQNNLDFEVAHLNYQLRGKESDADQAFVYAYAKRNDLNLHIHSVDTTSLLADSKLSVQMLARSIRYDWFNKLMKERELNILLTAHHQNDAAESFFLNLLRGTGIRGLRGITNRENLHRPLISCLKSNIYEYAQKNNIPFREDQSNSSLKYERNWLRNDLFPNIRKRFADFDKIMYKNIANLKEDYEIIETAIKQDLRKAQINQGEKVISIDKISQLQFPERALFFLLENYGFNREIVTSVLQSINSKSIGTLFYSNSHQLLVDRNSLIIESKFNRIKVNEVIIFENTEFVESPIKLRMSIREKVKRNYSTKELLFDADNLVFPLTIRPWAKGDRMSIFGMKGTKKVSDILIDDKINRFEKEKIYVLENEQGILSLVGIRRSQIATVDEKTKRILKIEIQDD